MTFRIKEAREQAGYSQKELAEIIGVAPNTFHGYESGKHDPKSELLAKIAQACNVTVDFILGRESETKKSPDAAEAAPEAGGDLSKAEEDFFMEFRKLPESHKGLAADLCTALVRELVKHQTIESKTEVSVPAGSGR